MNWLERQSLLRRAVGLLAVVTVFGACSSIDPVATAPSPTADGAVGFTDEATPTTESEDDVVRPEDDAAKTESAAVLPEVQPAAGLPERPGPRRETTGSVPHIQVDAELVAEVDAELRRRAFLLPGVENRASVLSLPGAIGLWLSDDMDLARADVLGTTRELGHIHPDGSLHVWLPVELAAEVDQTKWGELHPWVTREGFWNGVAMIYTPETLEELDITMQLLVGAYNFVVGANIDPAEIV